MKMMVTLDGHERLIKLIEYVRGLYRYPGKMIGRHIPATKNNKTDVLVFAAHQDDDVFGMGATLMRHQLNKDDVKVVFVTDGTGWRGVSWKMKEHNIKSRAETRYREAVAALSLIGIPKDNVLSLGFPDGGTQRYLKSLSKDIEKIIQIYNPKRIYTHCIEGGHRDHDLTSFAVKMVCKKLGFNNVFEWTEYHPNQPLGTSHVKFIHSTSENPKEIKLTDAEQLLKRQMLACHQSQNVEQCYTQGEAIRKSDLAEAEKEILQYGLLTKTFFKAKIEEKKVPDPIKAIKGFKTRVKERLKSNKYTYAVIRGIRKGQFVYYPLFINLCLFNIKKWLRLMGFYKNSPYERLKKVKNKHRGERCFIVATGPSLTISDLEKLRHEVTIGVNSICLAFDETDWRPTYYGIQDENVYEKLREQIERLEVKAKFISDTIPKKVDIKFLENDYLFPLNMLHHNHIPGNCRTKFSSNPFKAIYSGFSVTYSMIQIAAYMGFKEIYLLGADCHYSLDQKNHVHEYGYLSGDFLSLGNKMIQGFQEAKKYADRHRIKIYNATRGGMLEVFERVNLDEVVSKGSEFRRKSAI
ncbi:PIG-L family deacetylase [Camelliibacillus cellulosilyticus]|uniref:PIG-L family deacetylase n=1 Tax=Camelliibacillus cellulosilyticus TaxID=2174486 RepID=A0ABV9GSD9_9BACL